MKRILLSCWILGATLTYAFGQHGTHNHNHETQIQLNNGKKWKIPKNMMQHIRDMEKEVLDFDKRTKSHDTVNHAEYQVLGNILNTKIQLLTANCTMSGQAHDELHKWLVPYIHLVENLLKTKTTEGAKPIFSDIKHSFEVFNQFFM